MERMRLNSNSFAAEIPAHKHFYCIALCFLLLVLVCGCTAIGPDYTRPEAQVGSNWIEIEETLITSEPPVDPQWWKKAFHEPDLDQLDHGTKVMDSDLADGDERVEFPPDLAAVNAETARQPLAS